MNGAGLGRWLRTVRHLRARQVAGQIRHRLVGSRPPRQWSGEPPKLVIPKPVVPFLPAPKLAWSDGACRFRLRNREVGFEGRVNWDYADAGPLWAFDLHGFEWARRTTLAPGARRALVLDWIDRHRKGIGWSPHPTSLRTIAWIKLLLTPGALREDARILRTILSSLGSQLDYLAANLETHLLANHYLSNLLAITLCGFALDGVGADRWRSHHARLVNELAEQIGGDGLHCERSPMYHALLLESVLDLVNIVNANPGIMTPSQVANLIEISARMLGALVTLVHPDGEIALLADSSPGISQRPETLISYASQLGIAPQLPERIGVLSNGGYIRLAAGPFVLIASVAGPKPAYQPGHAHCDALSFELSVERDRVVTDTGVYEYIPGPLRDISRSTRSHATLEVGGAEQAEVWAAHRVGGRPVVSLDGVEQNERLVASCSGWATPGTTHVRTWALQGSALRVTDVLRGTPCAARLSLPLAPGLEPRMDGATVRIELPGGRFLRIELEGGPSLQVMQGVCFPEFGRKTKRAVLVAEAAPWPRTCLQISLKG